MNLAATNLLTVIKQICVGQNNDLNTFHLVVSSFLVINLSETLSNDQKSLVLHNVISYNDVTFDATDHAKQINCDRISFLRPADMHM